MPNPKLPKLPEWEVLNEQISFPVRKKDKEEFTAQCAEEKITVAEKIRFLIKLYMDEVTRQKVKESTEKFLREHPFPPKPMNV
jgi:hypothetical protein